VQNGSKGSGWKKGAASHQSLKNGRDREEKGRNTGKPRYWIMWGDNFDYQELEGRERNNKKKKKKKKKEKKKKELG